MRYACLAFLLLLPAGFATADEASCPSHRTAELGHSPFEEFHAIMAPAWHQA